MMTTECKIISDAIFGFISVKPHIVSIIDTPEFQRLRWIWQLGFTSFVYPTADHSRFEHSIGTYWLASKLVTQIQKQLFEENAEIEITDKDVLCVEIAALCHDIGHGPFSHTWDKRILPLNNRKDFFSHEEQFDKIWSILKRNKKIPEMLRNFSIEEEHESLIKHLVMGQPYPGKEVLSYIVSNSASGVDVDKWDYLARDSTYLGHAVTNYRVDIERMIHFARAIKGKEGKWEIAFRDSEGNIMIRVFQMRHYIHQTAYEHKTVLTIERMFMDGIERCINNDFLKAEEIKTAEWILQNTDGVFWSNQHRIPEFQRILNRDLYKTIFECIRYDQIKDPTDDIFDHLKKSKVDTSNVRIIFSQFQLGATKSYPMYHIPFYNKRSKNISFKYTKETIPSKLLLNYDESKLVALITSYDINDPTDKSLVDEIRSKLIEYFQSDSKWNIEATDHFP